MHRPDLFLRLVLVTRSIQFLGPLHRRRKIRGDRPTALFAKLRLRDIRDGQVVADLTHVPRYPTESDSLVVCVATGVVVSSYFTHGGEVCLLVR